jgi:hypothetical protein
MKAGQRRREEYKEVRFQRRQVGEIRSHNLIDTSNLVSRRRMELVHHIGTISAILGFPSTGFLESGVAWNEDGETNIYVIDWSSGEIVGYMVVEHPNLVNFFQRCEPRTIT